MSFNNPLGIEYRVVKDTQHNGEPARVVSGATNYDASPDELWDALTNAERIANWFLPISGDLELGGRYQLEGHAGGTISRCDPPSAFDVTWECGGNTSWVQVRLEPEDKTTRLLLEHIMLKDEESEKHWKQFGPGATGVGWELGFVGLEVYLKTGQSLIEESHVWMASENGKVFARKSAAEWGKAHIASGENEEIAQGMAEQTAKAYCGEL